MNDFFTGVLPWLLWVGRIALSAVAVLLLIRCGRTLLSGGKQESWGFLSLSNGARYPLYHWENMIGRARQADIRINFPSVSRSHAALCRDSEGIWRIYPIRTGGTLLNLKFTPKLLADGAGIRGMMALVRGYFNMDGHHIQFNVVDRQTLLDAQAHPEAHQDLIVRVAGYSDYFNNLTPQLQQEIIDRTAHEAFG